MVDTRARNLLAERLRHLASGRITNDEFEDSLWVNTEDRGYWAVKDYALGGIYGDLEEYKLAGNRALTKAQRRMVARLIVFLHSDREYEWPRHRYEGCRGMLLHVITLGMLAERFNAQWRAGRDTSVWPFARYSDYKRAAQCPKLLAGGTR